MGINPRGSRKGCCVQWCRLHPAQGQRVEAGDGQAAGSIRGEHLSRIHPRHPKANSDPASFVNHSFLLIRCHEHFPRVFK